MSSSLGSLMGGPEEKSDGWDISDACEILGSCVAGRVCREGCDGREDNRSCVLRAWKGMGDWKVANAAEEVGIFWRGNWGTWGRFIPPCGRFRLLTVG